MKTILGNTLTGRRGRPRIPIEPMTQLAVEVEGALKGKTIAEVARAWDVPRWVLDDLRHNRIKMPGAVYLVPIAKGLEKTVDQLVKLAHQEAAPRPSDATIASGKTSPTTS